MRMHVGGGAATIRGGSIQYMYMMVAVARTLAFAHRCVSKPLPGGQLSVLSCTMWFYTYFLATDPPHYQPC